MDLGLKGKRAIVCAASKGLGRGCAEALAREGVSLVITARGAEALERTAAEIRAATGASVVAVAGDIATEAGRQAALAACPEPDILVNNAGGPPAGDFRQFTHEDWLRALEANMLTPIFLIRAVIDGMIARRFGRIVNITSGSVKSPIATLGMSNGARAGLTGFVAGVARQVARHNVTINNLLPGPFLTDRLRANSRGPAAEAGISRRCVHRRVAPRRRPPAGSARRRSSAPPAPFSAPPPRASSSGRTCCSMAAPSIRPWAERGPRDGSRVRLGAAAGRDGAAAAHRLPGTARPHDRADRADRHAAERRGGARFRAGAAAGAGARPARRGRQSAAWRADHGQGELRRRRPADHLGLSRAARARRPRPTRWRSRGWWAPGRWCSARPTCRARSPTGRASTTSMAPPTTRGTRGARRAARRAARRRRSPPA